MGSAWVINLAVAEWVIRRQAASVRRAVRRARLGVPHRPERRHDRRHAPDLRLRVAGHLDDRWSGWFGGPHHRSRRDDGTCTPHRPGGRPGAAARHPRPAARHRRHPAARCARNRRDCEDDRYVDGSATGQQPQLAPSAHGGATVVDAELGVDVLGVGAQGVERHEQVPGDLGTVEVGGQQPEDLELTRAEDASTSARPIGLLRQRRLDRVRRRCRPAGRQQRSRMERGARALGEGVAAAER